jgi:Domain of unknown function (DUF4383)
MLKILAILFGLVLIVIGILGFLPDFTPGGKLFGYFLVNPLHNILHLLTGIVALVCGLTSGLASKVFFICFGLIYAAIAVLGFMMGQGQLFDLIAINQADNYLHAGIAILSLYFGLFLSK